MGARKNRKSRFGGRKSRKGNRRNSRKLRESLLGSPGARTASDSGSLIVWNTPNEVDEEEIQKETSQREFTKIHKKVKKKEKFEELIGISKKTLIKKYKAMKLNKLANEDLKNKLQGRIRARKSAKKRYSKTKNIKTHQNYI